MTKSLSTGIIINELLSNDSKLKQLVKSNIFPLMAKDVNFPYIVYRRTSLTPIQQKHGYVGDNITIEVDIIDDNYKRSVTIAQLCRNILDNIDTPNTEIKLIDATESAGDENIFIQTLNFNIRNYE